MRNCFALLVLLVFFGPFGRLQAQENPYNDTLAPVKAAKYLSSALHQSLGLSMKQASKNRVANIEFAKGVQVVRDRFSGTGKRFNRSLAKENKWRERQYRKIMDRDQFKAYEKQSEQLPKHDSTFWYDYRHLKE